MTAGQTYNACLFDFDGTIVMNSEEIHQLSVSITLKSEIESRGLTFDEGEFSRIWTKQLGGGIENFYNVYRANQTADIGAALDSSFSSAGAFEDSYEKVYLSLIEDNPKLLKVRGGIDQFVAIQKQAGAKIAVVSNAKQAILVGTLNVIADSTAHNFTQSIDLILGIDKAVQEGCEPKPSGDPYRKACEIFGVQPEDCYGIEDTRSGLMALVDAKVGYKVFCGDASHLSRGFLLANCEHHFGPRDGFDAPALMGEFDVGPLQEGEQAVVIKVVNG